MAAPFKAYDVRGIYGEDVTEALAYQLGRAYVQYTGARTVVVGRDMRPHSVPLEQELIRGLREGGADVIGIGMASTDMMYFAVINLGVDGGVAVTASHNPGEYNGFKFVREKAIPMGLESGLAELEAIVRGGEFAPPAATPGGYREQPVLDAFVAWMHEFVDPKTLAPLKVVIDAGNGMGGPIMEKMFQGSPVQVIPLFFEPDGTFPNHEANPLLEENRVDMVAKVRETGADLGIGLDGDCDRAFFVDGTGHFCDGDFILGLLAKPVLKRHPGARVVYDVRCSDYVRDTIQAGGGEARMWKVGHAFAKTYMREHQCEFGGEVSGHYYFRHKDAYFDSGCLTALLLLKTLSDQGQSLAQAMEETKRYHISGEINSRVQDADAVMAAVKTAYQAKGRLVEIDGLSIIGEGWWFNIRKSNTEPLLRLNCEAKTQEAMERLRDDLLAQIRGGVGATT
ncbi:MAG: phosphomannomutase/phosphoglucomutase [Candidatus Sericytochromatia bacterium]|nr:phosphomannomutase/phosphoglucomutase [Candidatus Sericytochromatia bacterium]